jgi:hypothetical protein
LDPASGPKESAVPGTSAQKPWGLPTKSKQRTEPGLSLFSLTFLFPPKFKGLKTYALDLIDFLTDHLLWLNKIN